MLIDAVLLFGLLNAMFEFVVLSKLSPKIRLRILGSNTMCGFLHVFCLMFNLLIHWGTLVGTMSGIFAFIISLLTVRTAKFLFGYIRDGKYFPGLKVYSKEQLT
jgi:hypothetical protein